MNKARILLVDDEPSFTRMLKLNLEKTNKYQIETVNRSTEAIQRASEFRPDIVVLDLVMPELDGSDVAQQLRNDEQTKDVPIIFLSALIANNETASAFSEEQQGSLPLQARRNQTHLRSHRPNSWQLAKDLLPQPLNHPEILLSTTRRASPEETIAASPAGLPKAKTQCECIRE